MNVHYRRFPVRGRYLEIGLKKTLSGNRPEKGVSSWGTLLADRGRGLGYGGGRRSRTTSEGDKR